MAAKALDLFAAVLPKLAPLVRVAANAVGDLFDGFARFVNSGGADSVIAWFTRNAGPAIRGFGKILGNLVVGFGGLVAAFAPLGRDLMRYLVGLTDEFAKFGQSAQSNDGVKGFIDYVRKVGPKVAAFFGDLITIVVRVGQALAPIGDFVLAGFGLLADLIKKIPVPVLTAIAAAVISVVVALKAMSIIGTLIGGGWAVAIVAAVAAIGVGLVTLYKRSETFRKVVNAAWSGIKKAAAATWKWMQGTLWPGIKKVFGWIASRALWLWNKGIKPAFRAVWKFITKELMPIIRRLWNRVVKPAFKGIATVVKDAWNGIIKPVLKAFWWYITKFVVPVIKSLWNNVVKPVFKFIGKAIAFAWKNVIKPILHALISYLDKVVFPVIRWLYNKVVKPVFRTIGRVIGFAWNNVIKPIFTAIKQALTGDLSGAFNTLKDVAGDVFSKIWDIIKGLPGKIVGLGKKMFQAGKSMIGKLWDGLLNVGSFVADVGKDFANAVIGFLNDAIPNELSIPGPNIDLPNNPIPKFAKGGYVSGPTLAMVGEGREAEAILPKSVLASLVRAAAAVGASVAGRGGSRAPGGDGPARGSRFGVEFDDRGLKKADKAFARTGKTVQKAWKQRIKPSMNAWSKSMHRDGERSVKLLERQVDRSADRMGKRFLTLRRNSLRNFSKVWSSSLARDAVRDVDSFQKGTDRATDRVAKGFVNFRRGPVRNLSKDWGETFRRKTPADVAEFRSKTTDHMQGVASNIRDVWADRVRPTLTDFGRYPRKHVAPAFRKGADAIGNAWETVEGKAKKPIRFVIGTVLNRGLIRAFNKIAKFVDAKTIDKITMPKGFARGGYTGPGGKYTPAGIVHAGEYVINKESTSKLQRSRPGLLDSLNRGNDNGMRPSERDRKRGLPGYWVGGGVAPIPGFPTYPSHGTNYYDSNWASDYAVPVGTPIRAWKEGRVVEVSQSGSSYGNETVINHPSGEWSRYAHQLKQMVSAGMKVAMGQVIGLSGDTGNSTGPHLHLELGGGAMPFQGGSGSGGAVLPGWAQKIISGPKKWAEGLLGDKLKGGGFKGAVQGLLDNLIGPSAEWARSQLGSFMGASAGAFGAGAQGVWKSLMSTGFYSPQQAAGVMGNMQHESGFVPNIVQGGGRSWNPASAGSAGYGLVQWTPGSKLIPYLGGRKPTIAAQVDALTAQLRGRGPSAEGAAGAALKATRTPEHAARVFGLEYERYAGGVQTGRETAARAIFERFSGKKFDRGGVADGVGFMQKWTPKPERVLSPRQTVAFEKWMGGDTSGSDVREVRITSGVLDITENGKAMIRGQARAEIGTQAAHARTVGRQYR